MTTRKQIIDRLRALSKEMIDVGAEIDYYYGFNPLAAHGTEMVGAGHIASSWADEMDLENE